MMMILPENVSTTTDCVKTLPLFLKWIIHIKIFCYNETDGLSFIKMGEDTSKLYPFNYPVVRLFINLILIWGERERERRWLKEEELSKSTQPDVRPIIINLSWIATKGSEKLDQRKWNIYIWRVSSMHIFNASWIRWIGRLGTPWFPKAIHLLIEHLRKVHTSCYVC